MGAPDICLEDFCEFPRRDAAPPTETPRKLLQVLLASGASHNTASNTRVKSDQSG